MIANSPAAVAAAFSSNSSPVAPGDSRCAAIPDPITMAARNALPRNSASSRRHSAAWFTAGPASAPAGRAADRPARLSAAWGAVGDRRLAGLAGAAAACLPVTLGVEGLAVAQDRVDLPGLAVGGALDPELVLLGVTARGLALAGGGQARPGQARLLGTDGARVGDLDAQVVEAAAVAGVFQQDQLQRRVGDGEVGIAGAALGRAG